MGSLGDVPSRRARQLPGPTNRRRVGVPDDAACPDGRVGPPIYNGGAATPLWFALTSIRGSAWGHAHGLVDEGGEPEWGVRRPVWRPASPSGIATYGRRRSANPPLSPGVPAGVAEYLPSLSPVAGAGQNQPPTRCATGRSHCEENERCPDGPDRAKACAATPVDEAATTRTAASATLFARPFTRSSRGPARTPDPDRRTGRVRGQGRAVRGVNPGDT